MDGFLLDDGDINPDDIEAELDRRSRSLESPSWAVPVDALDADDMQVDDATFEAAWDDVDW